MTSESDPRVRVQGEPTSMKRPSKGPTGRRPSVDRPNGRTDDQRAKPTRPLSSPLRESGSRLLHAGSPPERKGVVYKRTGRGRSVPERRAPASAFPANHLEPELRH